MVIFFSISIISSGAVDKLQVSPAFFVCKVELLSREGWRTKALLWNLNQDPKVPAVFSHPKAPHRDTCFSLGTPPN